MTKKCKQNKNTCSVLISIICFISLFFSWISIATVPAWALVDVAVESAFAAWASAYGLQAGAGFDYANMTVEARNEFFGDQFDLWQQSMHDSDSSYTPVSCSDFVNAHVEDVEYTEQFGIPISPGGVGAYYTSLKFNSAIADGLNKFWNWFCESVGLVRQPDGGFAGVSGTFDSAINLSSTIISPAPTPITEAGWSYTYFKYPQSDTYTTLGAYITDLSSPVYYFTWYTRVGNYDAYYVRYVSGSPFRCIVRENVLGGNAVLDSSSGLYIATPPYGIGTGMVPSPDVPNAGTNYSGALSELASYVDGTPLPSISLVPYNDKTVISIPDVEDQDYIAEPVETVIGIPWDDLYRDPTDAIEMIAPIAEVQAIDNTFELVEEAVAPLPPTEFFSPLLPVNLPSFNFNFSGIWHYVVDWINSLRSWFSLMFSVWSGLPYAMVVPVYASAVVVIVVGMYRRFFM